MKTKILLLILFCSSFAFGQKTTWGAWEQNPCYKGIWFRVKLRSYNSAAKQYEYDHEFKNTYNVTVTFTYDIKDSAGDGRTTIKPGQTSSSWNFLPYNGRVNYSLNKVCFHHPNGFDQCSEYNSKGYASFAECDNGTPNYKIWDGNKNSNSPNNNNSKNDSNTTNPKKSSNDNGSGLPTAQQNQQSEIHRQHEQNRIIQETNNRRQQYVNVYNEGVDLGNSGKHAEAAAKYQEAIGLATNEQERKQAQDAYDRASKSGATVEIIAKSGEIYDAIEGVFSAIQKDKEAKRQKEAKEKETYLKNLTNNRDYHLDVISLDNSEMDLYNDYILDKFIEKGYKITLLQSPTLSSNKNIKSSVYRLQQSNEDFLQLHTDFTFADDQGLKRLCSVCSPNKSIKQITSITKEIFENSLKKIDVQDNEGYKCVDFSIDISPNFIKDNTQLN